MIYSHLRLVGGLSIFFLVLTIQALAQATLLPIQVKGLWGYIDGKGQIAIKPQFQNARGFSDGLAAVSDGSVNGKCGYINDVGHLAIDVIFAHCGDFYGGLAAAETGEKFGYINTRGSFVIPPQWQSASGFSDEMARVTEGELDAIRYGFIDRKGVMVIKAKYVYANDFHEDLALAAISVKGGLKIGFIDKQGRWKIKPRFGSATDFSEGYACVADEGTLSLFEGNLLYQPDGTVGKAYYIDKNGKRAFQGHFDSCGALSEGLAPVEINDKWQFIDRTGKVAITTNFPSSSDIATFSEGLAAVNSAGGAKFIDKNGKVVIETPFDWADKFVNGIARVKRAQKNGTVSSGYIDRAGKVIWEPSE